jgi:CelD/BcsL family acetyltransferase involved in cellulose biosynthesis
MDLTFTLESFDSLYPSWQRLQDKFQGSLLFSSPAWSKVWWQHFGSGAGLFLGAVRHCDKTIGIAPLLVTNNIAYFIGNKDVCDYLDFIIEPGQGTAFFDVLLDSLAKASIMQLDLAPLRPDSTVLTLLVDIAPKRGWQVQHSPDDVSVILDLPATWEEYLQLLETKQRHELRRKLRRLSEEGAANYRITTEANTKDFDIFFRLFRDSRHDKAAFLTTKMESFFRSVATIMAGQKLLRLGILEVDNSPVAATMCFDNRDDVYLYNSGYDPEYSRLSVGLISKALCIKDSIERGKKRFDFLKGGEEYKYRLGGHDLPLYRGCLKLIT